jgi:hypothetical protein
MLERGTDLPVINETGLPGRFNLEVTGGVDSIHDFIRLIPNTHPTDFLTDRGREFLRRARPNARHSTEYKDTELLNAGFFQRLMAINFGQHTSGSFGFSHVGKENMALLDAPPISRGGQDECLGPEAINLFCNARLRSLFANLCFRLREKRALSPLSADMMTLSVPGSLRRRSQLLSPGDKWRSRD